MKNNFYAITKAVKQPEYYVTRPYQTIGGMWTVDTWTRGDVTVQVMDEGYTTVIRSPGLKVVFSAMNEITIEEGTEQDLSNLAKELCEANTL